MKSAYCLGMPGTQASDRPEAPLWHHRETLGSKRCGLSGRTFAAGPAQVGFVITARGGPQAYWRRDLLGAFGAPRERVISASPFKALPRAGAEGLFLSYCQSEPPRDKAQPQYPRRPQIQDHGRGGGRNAHP